MLRRIAEDEKPDYFAVVFDAPGKTFRDDWYPEYKAKRPPMPDDLVVAEAHVGKAIVIKRFTPRGRGRVGRIFKPFANLTIVVRQVEAAAAAPAAS